MTHSTPNLADAASIVERLTRRGYEAYLVGGTVRDLLLKRAPHDFDIATSASPDQVMHLFPDHHAIGVAFGVVNVSLNNADYHVATFRSEANYADRRRPSTVDWASARDDVQRRDLTINGLLLDPTANRVIDYVGGQADLDRQLIRFIGDPGQRVREDPLRILRAVRLKAALDFQYDADTYEALRTHRQELRHVASERVREEFDRMLESERHQQAIEDLEDLGVLEVLLPEVAQLRGVPQPREFHREGDVFDHTLKALGSLPRDAPTFLAWAVLLHDAAKPEVLTYGKRGGKSTIITPEHAARSAELADTALKRLRFSTVERTTITWLVRHHMSLKHIDEMRPAKREQYVLDPRFPWLLELHKADVLGTDPADLSLYREDLALYKAMKAAHEREQQESPKPLVTGHDLIEKAGLSPGPVIATLLEELRNAQLEGKLTTKDQAIEYARTKSDDIK